MSKFGLWLVALAAALFLGWLVYIAANLDEGLGGFGGQGGTDTTRVEIPSPTRPSPPPGAGDGPLPDIRVPSTAAEPAAAADEPEIAPPPVEVAPPPEPEPVYTVGDVQLPTLNNSDGFVLEMLREFEGGAAVVRLLASQQLIRRFVVFVHNVSEGSLPLSELPYRRLEGEMPARAVDENLYEMEAAAHRRFNRYVDAFTALEPEQVLYLYRTLLPLFRHAYGEIGYNGEDFDATLQRAIGRVLDAPPSPGPHRLLKPSVMYLYADSATEELTAVEKQLIRLGPGNAGKLRSHLRTIRDQL